MKTIFRIIVLFLSIQITNAQTFNPQLASILQDTLNKYVGQITNIKGMSVCIYLPGQGTWNGTTGLSYTGQAITSDMQFGIASNTKLFVATAILQLAEKKILNLNDSLHKWLPTYNNINPNITIRQLLNHTSGISEPISVSPYKDTIMKYPNRVFTPDEILKWVGKPMFNPGAGWGYSNINYIIAGMIAENASGYHISKLIRDNILTPLNLNKTFYDVKEPVSGTLAHRWFNGIDYHDTSRVGLNTAGGCAGALFSTATEMTQWYHALMSGQILDSASFSELTTFVTTGVSYTYSLGLEKQTFFGQTTMGHGGTTWGYKSRMVYDPCLGAVVCGLANSWPAGMDGVTLLLYKVLVDLLPGCAGVISGQAEVCQGQDSVIYTVPVIKNATSYNWTFPNGASGTSSTNSIKVNYGLSAVSGNITVEGVNNYGFGGNAAFSVKVNKRPPTPVITKNGNVLHSNATAGNQWYDSNGIINGAISQDYTATANGNYYVIVTLSGCSSDTSDIFHFVLPGFHDNESNSSIKVYPNPVINELVIEQYRNTDQLSFEILNAIGQVIFKGNLEDKTCVQTNNFAPGVYLIKFENDQTFEFIKIIKE